MLLALLAMTLIIYIRTAQIISAEDAVHQDILKLIALLLLGKDKTWFTNTDIPLNKLITNVYLTIALTVPTIAANAKFLIDLNLSNSLRKNLYAQDAI